MTENQETRVFDLAIIGGGAGGVLAAIHALQLAKQALHIVLIEPNTTLAQGVAYATTHAEHLLNVPAGRMSGFAAQPGDFLDYIVANDTGGTPREQLAHQYIERRRYGAYLRERLQQALASSAATLSIQQGRVVALDNDGDTHVLALENASHIRARGVLLAVGNTPKPLPAHGASGLAAAQRLAAWDFDAIKRIPVDAEVCIAGSGLSMVDSALSLAANGHRGRIHVVSRHALLPLSHAPHAVADFDPAPMLRMSLRQRLRFVRERVREATASGMAWQSVMEALRPHGQRLWTSLSACDQRSFLRHVVRYWDVHRHRIAAPLHALLQAMIDSGQMQLHRGRLQSVAMQGPRVRVNIQLKDGRAEQFDVDVVVNATGVEMRAQTMRNPLLGDLLGKGRAVAGPHGIGILTDAEGRVIDADGHAQPGLMALGSLRIGSVWESIAVPELRGQAETAARKLLGLHAQ